MMGPDGLTDATENAILSANYVAKRLAPYYPILYTDARGINRARMHPRHASGQR